MNEGELFTGGEADRPDVQGMRPGSEQGGAGQAVRPVTADAVADAVRAVLDDPAHARAAGAIGESVTDVVDALDGGPGHLHLLRPHG